MKKLLAPAAAGIVEGLMTLMGQRYLPINLNFLANSGAVFGIGAYWANTKSNQLKYCGMNLLPAVFVAEGMDEVLHVSDYSHMIPAVILKIAIGITLYVIINRKFSLKVISLAFFIGFSTLGADAYMALGSKVLA